MAHLISRAFVKEALTLPSSHVWLDYDEAADVLYIGFRKPQQANDSVMEDDGNIYHYRDDVLVGITILQASTQNISSQSCCLMNCLETILRRES